MAGNQVKDGSATRSNGITNATFNITSNLELQLWQLPQALDQLSCQPSVQSWKLPRGFLNNRLTTDLKRLGQPFGKNMLLRNIQAPKQ